MTSRRGFLSLLLAAPFAAPDMAKAAVAGERYSGVVGQLGFSLAEYKPIAERAFDFDRDVAWGIKRISPADVAILADGPTAVTASPCDDPHDPVSDYFC